MTTSPWQVQAVWVSAGADGAVRMAAFPPKHPAGQRFLLTNDFLQLAELLDGSAEAAAWSVIDLAELYRLLHPESAAETLDDMQGRADAGQSPEERLWRFWLRCEADLQTLPVWALEMVADACQELDEPGTASLFRLYGRQAARRQDAAETWTATFAASVKRVERPDLPDLADCTAVDPGQAADLLAEGGALARCVPGYEPRPGQLMMVRAVVEAINQGRHLVVEAGTGVGKSLGYLLPAALWSRLNDVPVVISTNTRNLQTQLIEKDLPAVQRMLDAMPPGPSGEKPRPLRTALIKGRSNYLCLRRLANLMDQKQFDLQRRELRQFAGILCWAARTPDGDLDTLAGGAGLDPGITLQLTSHAEECSGHACRLYRRCFVQKAREKALRADLVIANHSLVFTEMGTTTPVALPKHAQVIFDEAHNLEEAATRHFSVDLTPARLQTFARRLSIGRGKRRRGLIENIRRRVMGGALGQNEGVLESLMPLLDEAVEGVEALRRSGQTLFRVLRVLLGSEAETARYAFAPDPDNPKAPPPAPTAAWRSVREAQAAFQLTVAEQVARFRLMADLIQQGCGDELNLLAEETSDITGAIQSLTELASDADFVLAGQDGDYVFWVQRMHTAEPLAAAWAAPLRVGPQLAKGLYETKQSVVFCSATLSVGGRFTYIGGRLGLDLIDAARFQTCLAPSPFDYVRQCQLLVPAYLPDPNDMDRSYVTELAHLIRQTTVSMGGRTLCLFTSYEMLRQCARLAEPELQEQGIRVLVHGESGSRDLILRTFRRGGRCVLFGTHSFWEGVDVVGDALSCVILARLPFASPGDPVLSARCEQIDNAGQSSFRALSLPAAVLRLRQGFGRLIRHRGDQGLVIVADTRILTKSYGGVFRKSLPSPVLACDDPGSLMARVGACAAALSGTAVVLE